MVFSISVKGIVPFNFNSVSKFLRCKSVSRQTRSRVFHFTQECTSLSFQKYSRRKRFKILLPFLSKDLVSKLLLRRRKIPKYQRGFSQEAESRQLEPFKNIHTPGNCDERTCAKMLSCYIEGSTCNCVRRQSLFSAVGSRQDVTIKSTMLHPS